MIDAWVVYPGSDKIERCPSNAPGFRVLLKPELAPAVKVLAEDCGIAGSLTIESVDYPAWFWHCPAWDEEERGHEHCYEFIFYAESKGDVASMLAVAFLAWGFLRFLMRVSRGNAFPPPRRFRPLKFA